MGLNRSKIAPFEDAYTSFVQWKDSTFYPIKNESNGETEIQDPLYLCHLVCREVLQLSMYYKIFLLTIRQLKSYNNSTY